MVHGTPAEVSYLRTLLVEDCVNRDVNYREFIYELRTFEHNDNQFDELLKSLQEQQKKQMKEEKN